MITALHDIETKYRFFIYTITLSDYLQQIINHCVSCSIYRLVEVSPNGKIYTSLTSDLVSRALYKIPSKFKFSKLFTHVCTELSTYNTSLLMQSILKFKPNLLSKNMLHLMRNVVFTQTRWALAESIGCENTFAIWNVIEKITRCFICVQVKWNNLLHCNCVIVISPENVQCVPKSWNRSSTFLI